MKDRALFMLVIMLVMPPSILFAAQAVAQDEIAQDEKEKDYNKPAVYASDIADKDKTGDITVGPGMELRKIGSLNLVVPKGARIHKDRSQWIMEGPEDFAVRNISEIKTRLDSIEKEQKELKDSIGNLEKSMKKPQE